MARGILDDLNDWGKVLEELARLRKEGLLDDHQPQLARLVRFRGNWRLQAEALKCAMLINRADDLLVAEALNVLVDRDLTVQSRVLAARALGRLIPRCSSGQAPQLDLDGVLRTMSALAGGPCNPVLRDEIAGALYEATQVTDFDLPDTASRGLVGG